MTTSAQAEHTVIGSLFAVGVLDLLHDAATGTRPHGRQLLGLTVAGLALTAMAGPAPQLAAGFALLLLISSLYTVGEQTLSDLGKALS